MSQVEVLIEQDTEVVVEGSGVETLIEVQTVTEVLEEAVQGPPGVDGEMIVSAEVVGETLTLHTNHGQTINVVGSILGPQGEQGVQGPAGPQGVQGEIGPQGPIGANGANAFTETDPVFTYTSGQVTRIDYASGNYKLFTYTAGVLTQLDYVQGSATVRKTFTYNPDGTLASVTETLL